MKTQTCVLIHVVATVIWLFSWDFHGVSSFCEIQHSTLLGILYRTCDKPMDDPEIKQIEKSTNAITKHKITQEYINKFGMETNILWIKDGMFWIHLAEMHFFFAHDRNNGIALLLTIRCLAISSYDKYSSTCSSIQSGKSRMFMVKNSLPIAFVSLKRVALTNFPIFFVNCKLQLSLIHRWTYEKHQYDSIQVKTVCLFCFY